MAALDFPSSPANGQLYPNPAVAGQPQYTYDGEKWTGGAGVGNIYISDSPPAAPVGSLWWESDTGILYVRYYDGTSTQWCQVLAGPGAAVLYTAQSLTEAQQVQARQNVYAAPFDAMAYNGMQVNGTMEVSHVVLNAAVLFPTGFQQQHLVDGWHSTKTGTNAYNIQQVASVFPGYTNALKLTVTTAQPTLGGDVIDIGHRIEGVRVVRAGWGTANAVPVTVGFWVKSSVAGSFPVNMINFDGSTVAASNALILSANVTQWITVTFPAQTTGTWKKDINIGMVFSVRVAMAGFINIAATNGNTFEITGLVVLPGIEAPSAARAPFITRSFDQEFLICQRYYQKSYHYGTLPGTSTGLANGIMDFATTATSPLATAQFMMRMRTTPTIVTYDSLGASGKICASGVDGTTPANVDNVNDSRFKIYHGGATRLSFNYTADARL